MAVYRVVVSDQRFGESAIEAARNMDQGLEESVLVRFTVTELDEGGDPIGPERLVLRDEGVYKEVDLTLPLGLTRPG